MKVYPIYITVFFIAKAAVAHGSQDFPVKDVARQDHSRRQREDLARYPNFRRKNALKWRNYHLSPPNEVSLSRAEMIRHRAVGDWARHSSRKKKFSPTTEGFFESDTQKPEENASTLKQETEATPTEGMTDALPERLVVSDTPGLVNKDHAVVNIPNELPTRTVATHPHHNWKLSKPVDRIVSYSKWRPVESSPDCPTSVDSMFVCQKCRTHFIVKINIRESTCTNCADDQPSCSENVRNKADDYRGKREGVKGRHKTKKACTCIGPCTCPKPSNEALSTFDPPPPSSFAECPSNVENMFQCPKCCTHYIVRINIKESKCCHNADPPCGSESKIVRNDARQKPSNARYKREDVPRHKAKKISCDPPISTPECPNSLESMFICPKCRTHYAVRINIKESKCCHYAGTAPPCMQNKLKRRKQNRENPKTRTDDQTC